jgi:hypothetical protein
MENSIMLRVVLLPFLLYLSFANAAAQEPDIPKAQSRGEGTYYKLFTIELKPGKTDDALEILNATLIPAWREAGVSVQVLEELVNTRDVLLLIELKDGPAALSYSVPRQDALAWARLVRIAGSAQAAEQAMDKFISYVSRQSETVVFQRR